MKRDPVATRNALLNAAFAEIYEHSFQGASVQRILARTKVTKGAFFHHFPSKVAMGHAVLDEIIAKTIEEQWIQPLETSDDPLHAIEQAFERAIQRHLDAPAILGCPLNNLSQEMALLDPGFRQRAQSIFSRWIEANRRALQKAQALDLIRQNLDVELLAQQIVAIIQGTNSLAKATQSSDTLYSGLNNLRSILKPLRIRPMNPVVFQQPEAIEQLPA